MTQYVSLEEAIYAYVVSLGFTGAKDDAVRAYLVSVVTLAQPTDCTADLWRRYGAQLGAPSTDINQIQKFWAESLLSAGTGGSWNDALRGIPS